MSRSLPLYTPQSQDAVPKCPTFLEIAPNSKVNQHFSQNTHFNSEVPKNLMIQTLKGINQTDRSSSVSAKISKCNSASSLVDAEANCDYLK